MKKFYSFICIAAALLLSAPLGNSAVPQRSTSTNSGSGIKSINRQAHFSKSATTQTAAISKATEEGITVPFTHSLGKDENANEIYNNIVDANEDTKTWKPGYFTSYSVCMKPTDASIDKMDDWMFSPAISLEAGAEYELSLDTKYALSSGTKDLLDLHLGQAMAVADMTQTITSIEITSKNWTTSTAKFSVDADGLYHIGFHAVSDKATSGNIAVCNLSLKKLGGDVETVDPPAAGTLTYEVYPKGELKAHIAYTAPTLTKSGAPLDKIAKVEIINRWYEKFEYTDVEPGQVIERDVDLFAGMANNRIQATAYVTDSKGNMVAGDELLVTGIMAGDDTPLTPENIKVTLSDDRNHVTVSWDAVGETGENGGYVDPSAVTYYIFDAFGSYYDPALAETSETSYTFDYSDATGPDFIAYQVTAGYKSNYSLEGVSDIITYGPALKMPFKESFANAYYESVWVTDLNSSRSVMAGTVDDTSLQTNADDPDAEPQYLTSQDNDNGFFYFLPMEKDDLYGLMSLPVSIEGAKNPILEFYAQGKGSVIDIMVGPSLPEMEVVTTIDFSQTPTDGWQPFAVELSDFAADKVINFELRMRAIHNDEDHTWSLPIDNIRIRDLVENNLAIASMAAPITTKVGEKTSIVARIENLGTKQSTPCEAKFYRNGVYAATGQVPALEPNTAFVVTFAETATIFDPAIISYTVLISNEGDEDLSDNSGSVTTNVIYPAHPTVTDIVPTIANGTVMLTWEPVSIDGLTDPATVEEDFESPDYIPLTIHNFGGWTMYDLDGGDNYTFLKDEKNPYRTLPCAFQLFDPVIAGVPDDYLIDCAPHSGNTMLVGWSTDGLNSNLLISPELSGEAQTVSFWAKSFSIAYGEEFSVYTSTTGKAVKDFTLFRDVEGEFIDGCVPEEWTEYTLNLPQGVKYFGILHNSYDTYALYLDDFSFEQAPILPADTELVGYNIYRDNVKVNSDPEESNRYIDNNPLSSHSSDITYRVSALYNNAESRLSEPVTVSAATVGIENVLIDEAAANDEYYRIDGVKTDQKNLTPGIYIRVSGSKASKVSIK